MASTIVAMSREAPPSRTAPQFVVRLPDEEFRDRIAEAAKANNRSMNAEIIIRLQESFERRNVEGVILNPGADRVARFFARERGQSIAEVVSDLVIAGSSPDSPAVVNLIMNPGATIDMLAAAFAETSKALPKNSTMVIAYPEGVKATAEVGQPVASQAPPRKVVRRSQKPKP